MREGMARIEGAYQRVVPRPRPCRRNGERVDA